MRPLPVIVSVVAALFVLYGILGYQVITGGAGWYAEKASFNPDASSLCFGTPVTMTVPFTRLGLNDAFDVQTYQIYHSGADGTPLAAVLNADPSTSPYIQLLSGTAAYSLPGNDPFKYPVGSLAEWKVSFTVKEDVKKYTGLCGGGSALPDGGCIFAFQACTGTQGTGMDKHCDVAGTSRYSEFQFYKTYYWYPTSHFPEGCPQPTQETAPGTPAPTPPVVGIQPIVEPAPIKEVIAQITPSQGLTKTTKILIAVGVGVAVWFITRKFL